MRLRRVVPLMLLATTGHLACGPNLDQESAAHVRQQLAAPNGLFQNSLSSNGLFQNGLFQNGLFQNGLFQNGLFQNGLTHNVLWQDALWQLNPAAREVLRQNPYTRQALTYIYECAMQGPSSSGPGQSTVLDPDGANVELHGLIGLAPEWGEPNGECSESCQRWVTACVLARTNAYGAKVDLSMRVPDNAPAGVRAALAATEQEKEAYPLREGAFYGNLFRQEQRPGGARVGAPKLYACSGRDSNIPQLTQRFNASPGAGGPIEVVDTCLGQTLYPRSACNGLRRAAQGGDEHSGDEQSDVEPSGALSTCYPTASLERQPDAAFNEVITVYLKQPAALCGNAVCEEGEPGANGSCSSDCPAGWATSFGAVLTQGSASSTQDHRLTTASWARVSALDADGSIIIAGVTPAAIGNLSAVDNGSAEWGVLLKFTADNTLVWGQRFAVGARASLVAVDVAPSTGGRISVVLNERQGTYSSSVHVVHFNPATGALLGSNSFEETAPTSSISATALAVNSSGDLFVTATLVGGMSFGPMMMLEVGAKPREFVLKLSSSGEPLWAARFGNEQSPPSLGARAIKVDSTGGALVTLRHGEGGALWRLTPEGTTKWEKKGIFGGAAIDPADGDIYVTGALEKGPRGETYDGFPWATTETGNLFIARYDDDASGAPTPSPPIAFKTFSSSCSDPMIPCAYRWFTGREIAFTHHGDLLVGVRGGSRSTIDLGGGPFRAYATDDVFVTALSKAELKPLWAKHLPMVLDGTLRGMHFGVKGEKQSVVLSGTYSGSMTINGRLLVSPAPELRSVGNTFLASFDLPLASDNAKPIIDEESLPGPPTPGGAEATSPDGARVFFVPPLAVDEGGAGVSVTCSPPPNSVFPANPLSPITVTPVECVATDPRGNGKDNPLTFDVQVIDRGPVFVAPPQPFTVDVGSTREALAFFPIPEATDLVDGRCTPDPAAGDDQRCRVTCTPASGSLFALGTTTVTCEVTDSKKTRTKVSFPVHVRKGGETCGNHIVDDGEECDDGNNLDGDDCTSACTLPLADENRTPDCAGASPSPAFLLASNDEWAPIAIEGVSDPDGDPIVIKADHVWQDEPVDQFWCPEDDGICIDAGLEPLVVRAERHTWAENDPQPDGRVYFIEFTATDPHGAQCRGAVEVCVQRYHDVVFCGRGDAIYNSLVPE